MKKFFIKLSAIHFSTNSFPLFLLLITLITYGPLIHSMGIYWDDWPFAWILHTSGPSSFIENFSMFRPFLGPIFVLTTSIIGESPLGWQILGILIRYLSSLALWWALRKIFPNNLRQASWIALFFLVFPGFQEQWVAFTHTNQALIPMSFQILSIGFMAWSLRTKKFNWLVFFLSIFFTILGLFPTEYFFGVELIRPLIIWIILTEKIPNSSERFKNSIIRYTPFAIILGLNASWLSYFHKSGNYAYVQADSILKETGGVINAMASFIQDILNTISVAGFESWFGSLNIFLMSFEGLTAKLALTLTITLMIIVSFYLSKLDFQDTNDNQRNSQQIDKVAIQMLILGFFGLFVGRIPSWAAGFPLRIEFPWDRLILPMMLGSSIAFIGLIDFFGKGKFRKIIFFSFFVSLAISQQFVISNTYKRDWENVQEFLWQLKWRMPDVKPGTSLITHELPFSYVTDNSLSAALNWFYEDQSTELESQKIMPYMLVYTKTRLGSPLLPSLTPDLPIKFQYRTYTYYGNTSDSVVFYYSSDGCLRVLDPIYANKNLYPDMTYMLTDSIGLSNPNQISFVNKPIGQTQTGKIFKDEPDKTWCYYYTKAELARQNNDWSDVIRIFNESQTLGLSTNQPVEMVPFIEAFGRTGEFELARKYTNEILKQNPNLSAGFCELWDRIVVTSQDAENAREVKNDLQDIMICED